MPYPGHSLWEAYPSAEVQSMYYTTPANWAINKKERNSCIVGFVVLADHRMQIKESKRIIKYLDLARELKRKLWNMWVTGIPIVVGALGTVPKGFEKNLKELEIRGRIEAIQTTAVLGSARVARRVIDPRWPEELVRSKIIINWKKKKKNKTKK